MYALLDFTEAADTEAALVSPEVRFYYDACPDYEAEALRRFPLVRNFCHEAGLALAYAGMATRPHRKKLQASLERILDSAALQIAQLSDKKGNGLRGVRRGSRTRPLGKTG